ncbi:hypothetical protein [Desulfonema magnum]|uniref:Uncharacterized protein n=1 Tax=Desulfonema magnum TaxID=45655 RepID=A0A975BWG1_9BACT|nr:hypothetical protein [Desulfonema magnum]QTA93006.1 Uncharacterized protein dnm_090990 [Desulfonema magnum]
MGQGEKDGAECIIVFVSCIPSAVSDIIPKNFKGFQVAIEETGELGVLDL